MNAKKINDLYQNLCEQERLADVHRKRLVSKLSQLASAARERLAGKEELFDQYLALYGAQLESGTDVTYWTAKGENTGKLYCPSYATASHLKPGTIIIQAELFGGTRVGFDTEHKVWYSGPDWKVAYMAHAMEEEVK